MKKILFTFILCLVTLFSMAQSMSVASFEYDEKDLTANTAGTIVRDQNDEKCALIRIQTTAKGFSFDVGALGVTKTDDNHVGECRRTTTSLYRPSATVWSKSLLMVSSTR